MHRRRMKLVWSACAASVALACALPMTADEVEVRGAWEAERYLLKDGTEHTVSGRIFFTDRDWTVLFFVMSADGKPQRGSGEGGTYTLSEDHLVFTHLYHLSAGEEMEGLPTTDLRMVTRGPNDAVGSGDSRPAAASSSGQASPKRPPVLTRRCCRLVSDQGPMRVGSTSRRHRFPKL